MNQLDRCGGAHGFVFLVPAGAQEDEQGPQALAPGRQCSRRRVCQHLAVTDRDSLEAAFGSVDQGRHPVPAQEHEVVDSAHARSTAGTRPE